MEAGARPAGKILQLLRPLWMGSAVFVLASLPAAAQIDDPFPTPRTNLGTIGLIEMPSARMAPDGELFAGASYFKNTQHYNLGFQILPWLEGSFRYSGLAHFNNSFPVYWDRSFGLKLRLWDEGDILPAVAFGINDVVGTGVYSGEYLVASKRFGDFDATLGVGWGRLGTANTFQNPLAQLSSSFETRPSLTSPGGTNFKVFLHGPDTGVFGGLVWRTPLRGLSLIAEASSDNYPFERETGNFTPHTQMNYGLSYQVSDGFTVGLNWLYGKAIGGSIAFEMDPTRSQYPTKLGPQPPEPVIRSPEAQQQALETMLDQRGERAVARRRSALARNDRGRFADALLGIGDITDVGVKGQRLSLSVASGDLPQICRAAATIARASRTGILDVTVVSARQESHCPVAQEPGPTLENAVLTDIHRPRRISASSPLLIDATAIRSIPDTSAALRKFQEDARKQRIIIEAVSFDESVATVYYTNSRYWSEAEALERLSLILMADAPTTIEKFRLIAVQSSVPQQEFQILRTPVERTLGQETDTPSIFDSPVTVEPAPLDNPVLDTTERGYPRFNWNVFPQFRQQFFDPNNPFGAQLIGAVDVNLELAPGLLLWAQGETSLVDSFTTSRESDSLMPHVRTDFVEYFKQGKTGLGGMAANYRFRATPEVFATIKAGYLESMFAGVGGEMLWRPAGQRWALGADLYHVWQRNFDRLFGLQPYHVTTGHVSLYYSSPWYDLDFQVRAGQYLAGDRGLTFQVTRRFSTGVEVGAFFTKTNVSSAVFGEGSFDKGIIIRIPLGWIAPIETLSQVALDLRPVQRDGGQVLLGDATLYQETQRSSESEFARNGINFARN